MIIVYNTIKEYKTGILVMKKLCNKKNGFTLPEVLITLALTGVVCALAIPSLNQSVGKIVLENSYKKQVASLSQGMTLLSIKSPRLNYQTTQAFVNEFQEFFKVSKVCNQNNIASCWPTEKVTLSDGSEYQISGAKTKNVFFMYDTDPDGNTAHYANDNVAFITANGTSIIINYNKDCNPNIGDSNRNCYVAVVDLNGEKSPNKLGEDIKVINARYFATGSVPVESSGVAAARQISR